MGWNKDVIDMEPITDPVTGATLWAAPTVENLPAVRGSRSEVVQDLPAAVTVADDGGVRVQPHGVAPESVALTRERFAGGGQGQLPAIGQPYDWQAVEAAQGEGQKVVINPDGTFRVAHGDGAADSVTLTRNQFAMGVGNSSTQQLPRERAAVERLARAGVTWVGQLAHTTTVNGMPNGSPVGWLYRPRPNRYGDRLVCVVAYHPNTGLYHSHLWRFDADVDGRGLKSLDLPRLIGRYPHLTHHRAHLYTSPDGSAVLCLSERVSGGMPSLEDALTQTLKWADGTGEVVRGRPFPYH